MNDYGFANNGMNMGMPEFEWLLPEIMKMQAQRRMPMPQGMPPSQEFTSQMPQLTPNSLYNMGSPSPTMPSSSVTSGATPKKSWGPTADAAMIGASMAMPSMLGMLQKDPYRVPPPDVDMPNAGSVGMKTPFQMPQIFRPQPNFRSMLAQYLRR